MDYLGACLIAGKRLGLERQVNTRVIPTSAAIDESVDLAHEIYGRVFRRCLMRHANVSTTMNVYGRASMKAKQEANSKVVEMVLPKRAFCA